MGLALAREKLLSRAAAEVQLLGTLTPVNAASERVRLVGEIEAGRPAHPRWSHAPVAHDDLRRALDAALDSSAAEPTTPLDALVVERLREISHEAALCSAAGTADVERCARIRYAPPAPEVARQASDLCSQWMSEPPTAPDPNALLSDSPDPRSLLSRMRAAVGQARLPFAVIPRSSLAALAAAGDGAIFVATGRRVSDEDVVRTVLHEVEGHARPRARALGASLAIVRAGTARGSDDQEGRALLLEERAGLLEGSRRRTLAFRHGAVEWMADGATFADVTGRLVTEHGVTALDAVLVAERAFRGSDGARPGLGRERVYLPSLLRVRAHLRERPQDEATLASGQISIEAAGVLLPGVIERH